MKVIAKENGFIDGTYRVAGEMFYTQVCPSWAEVIEGEIPVEKDCENAPDNDENTPDDNETPNKEDDAPAQENTPVEETVEDDTITPDEFEGMSEQEIQSVLDDLINQGVEKGILLENANDLTVREQIVELRKLLDIKEV